MPLSIIYSTCKSLAKCRTISKFISIVPFSCKLLDNIITKPQDMLTILKRPICPKKARRSNIKPASKPAVGPHASRIVER